MQEGGGCPDPESCAARCEVEAPNLCTADPAPHHNFSHTMWADNRENNPAFHDALRVFVPYCSSDVWTGTREAEEETAGRHFMGKHIVRAVIGHTYYGDIFLLSLPFLRHNNSVQVKKVRKYAVEAVPDDLVTRVPAMHTISQFVLIGASAGAFGVGFNCDAVAVQLTEANIEAEVRCVADGGDFYPAWLAVADCNPYSLGLAAAEFWAGQPDLSCAQQAEDFAQCLIFPSYFQYIDTPFMVVSTYEDTSQEVHPCTPPVGEDEQFWSEWRQEMLSLANTFISARPESGLFLPNCPYHVAVTENNAFAWDSLPVQVVGGEDTAVYRDLIHTWLEGTGTAQALDMPDTTNPHCPY